MRINVLHYQYFTGALGPILAFLLRHQYLQFSDTNLEANAYYLETCSRDFLSISVLPSRASWNKELYSISSAGLITSNSRGH
jgi:hypothetical protein